MPSRLYRYLKRTIATTVTLAIAIALPVRLATAETTKQNGDILPATLERIVTSPSDYLGERVTISGELEEILSTNTIELEEDDEPLEVLNDKRILVIFNTDFDTSTLSENTVLEVSGRVRMMRVADYRRQFAITQNLELLETIEVEYEGRPVIYADSVRVIE